VTDRAALRRDVVVVACALSAGIHAALAPSHLDEGSAAGGAFLAAAVLLGALMVVLTRHASAPLIALAAVTLAALITSYGAAITSGFPVLHPSPEPVEGLAVATKLVEAVGLAAALDLLWRGRPAVAFHPARKGTTT
jgi:hypothetical protein